MLVASQAVTSIKAFKKEITFSYLEFDNVTKALVPATSHAFNVEIGVCAAVFILLSAFMHGVVLLNWQKYIDDVNQGINKLRWYEYALSSSSKSCSFYVCAVHLRLSSSASSSSSSASSLTHTHTLSLSLSLFLLSVMICSIAILFGCYDFGSLLLMFFVNAVMNLFGLLMEKMNPPNRKEVDWTPFVFGCVAGVAPWLVVCMYFFGGGNYQLIPSFVYGILFGYFLFFNTFPVNMVLQYARIGRWKDYRVGEKTYIVLSLASKSLLTWLVFGGTFQPNGN